MGDGAAGWNTRHSILNSCLLQFALGTRGRFKMEAHLPKTFEISEISKAD